MDARTSLQKFKSSVESKLHKSTLETGMSSLTRIWRVLLIFIFIRLPLLKKWLQLTARLFNEFKCCCKYCPLLYSGEGIYSGRSKQKWNGPTRWSASSRICPNTLNVLLQLVSIWISRTLKEEMVRILDAIVSFTWEHFLNITSRFCDTHHPVSGVN